MCFLKVLYIICIRPKLKYACEVWGNCRLENADIC